jgi:hypothetical protein
MSKAILFITLLLYLSNNSIAQIVNQNSNPKPKEDNTKNKDKKNNQSKTDFTTAYFSLGYFNTFRSFEDHTAYNSKYKWETQTPTQNLGFNFGIYIPLAKHFNLDIGVNYLPYGEEYTYQDSLSDSTFHYINKYQQIGIPIRLKYTFINANPSDLGFKPFISIGVVPSNILSIRYFSDYTLADSTAIKNDVKKVTKDLNKFVFATTASIGFTYKTKKIGFKLMPEFRYNISNSYTGVFWKHNLWAWGVNAGIEIDF